MASMVTLPPPATLALRHLNRWRHSRVPGQVALGRIGIDAIMLKIFGEDRRDRRASDRTKSASHRCVEASTTGDRGFCRADEAMQEEGLGAVLAPPLLGDDLSGLCIRDLAETRATDAPVAFKRRILLKS